MIDFHHIAETSLSVIDYNLEKSSAVMIEAEYKESLKSLAGKLGYRGVGLTRDRMRRDYDSIEQTVIRRLYSIYRLQIDALRQRNLSVIDELKKKISAYDAETDELIAKSEKLVRQCDYIAACRSVMREKFFYSAEFLQNTSQMTARDASLSDYLWKMLERISREASEVSDLPVYFKSEGKYISISDFKVCCYATGVEFGKSRRPVHLSVTVYEPDGMVSKIKMKMYSSVIESILSNVYNYNKTLDEYYALKTYMECYKSQDEIDGLFSDAEALVDRAENISREQASLQQELDSALGFKEYLDNEKSVNVLIAENFIPGMTSEERNKVYENAIAGYLGDYPFEASDFFDPYVLAPKEYHDPAALEIWVNDRVNTIVNRFISGQEKYYREAEFLKKNMENRLAALNKTDLSSVFSDYAKDFPLYFQMGLPEELTAGQADEIIDKIRACAADQYSLRFYPSPLTKTDNGLTLPDFVSIVPDEYFGPSSNLAIEYRCGEEGSFRTVLNRTLLNILLSLPVGQVKLRIIDSGATNMASLFTTRLHPSFFNGDVILGENELRDVVAEWQDRARRVARKCGNIVDYNNENSTWLEPYEVVVVLGYPKSLSPAVETLLRPFVENGYKSGITFVFGVQADMQPAPGQVLLADGRLFKYVKCSTGQGNFPFAYTPLADNQTFLDAAIEYLNGTVARNSEKPAAVQRIDTLLSVRYGNSQVSDISVPVGISSEGDVRFVLDTVSHLHTFILGQSGTGKSRFLHNVIGNILLHYSPSQVELYLLDLKLGGVEFNPYKDEKHVRALLVDNNDRQVTLEILRELESRMEERSKEFARIGVRNLEMYNAKSEKMMPQLVLVIDECQMLFTERPDNIEREIRRIVSLTAKQGRSQGVHMIFSTQTFMNSAIPIDELQGAGLTDLYLMNCDRRDSEKLAKDSSSVTSGLKTGEIYYHHHQNSVPDVQFRSYYVDDAKQEEILRGVIAKTAAWPAGGQYYFSGKMQAVLDGETVCLMQKKGRRSLCAALGTMLDLRHEPVIVSLKEEPGENLLVFGLNHHNQTVRSAVEAFLSVVYSSRRSGRETRFAVIDCMPEDEVSAYQDILDILEKDGIIRMAFGRDRGEFLKELGDKVRAGTADETVVLVLGQEKWRELKNDRSLDDRPETAEPGPVFSGGGLGSARNQRTFRSELKYLLQNGSEYGVHFIIQVDRPQNLLAEQMVSQQMVKNLFRHWLMLKSAPEAGMLLRLRDDIRLETLSDDSDRLRAVYYSDDSDSYRLVTPFCFTTKEDNDKLVCNDD